MKKRLLMVGLIICFVFLLPVSAGAAVQNSNVSVTEEYWLMDNSGLHELTYEEYLECLEPEYYYNTTPNADITPYADTNATYTQKTAKKYLGTKNIVSPCAKYPALPTVTTSITTSATYSKSASAEAKAKIISAVQVNLRVSVAESSTSETGSAAGVTVDGKNGSYAVIEFQPYIAESTGTVTEKVLYNNGWRTNTYDVTSKHPVVLSNGHTYGLYTVRYSYSFIEI